METPLPFHADPSLLDAMPAGLCLMDAGGGA